MLTVMQANMLTIIVYYRSPSRLVTVWTCILTTLYRVFVSYISIAPASSVVLACRWISYSLVSLFVWMAASETFLFCWWSAKSCSEYVRRLWVVAVVVSVCVWHETEYLTAVPGWCRVIDKGPTDTEVKKTVTRRDPRAHFLKYLWVFECFE